MTRKESDGANDKRDVDNGDTKETVVSSAGREGGKAASAERSVDDELARSGIDSEIQCWLHDAERRDRQHVYPQPLSQSSRTSSRRLLTHIAPSSLPSTPMPDIDTPGSQCDPVSTYAPLLYCPACSPPGLLIAPTTLHCGHTVCAKHVRSVSPDLASSSSRSSAVSLPLASILSSSRIRSARPLPQDASSSVPIVPTCPLPTCQPNARQHVPAPSIHPESTVTYYPPLVHPGVVEPVRVTVPEPRIDVSIGRVLDVLEKAEACLEDSEDLLRREGSDNGTDEEDEKVNESAHVSQEERSVARQMSTSEPASERRRSSRSMSPRKRLRREEQSDGLHHQQRLRSILTTQEELEERFHKELTESLTCEICFLLLFQPVTTPCQHTFCAKCLQRSLDHGSKCPLCRQTMPPFSYFQDHSYNKVILAILLKAFPEIYRERGQAIEEEERDSRLDTPIFVFQLSFPGMPTLLHFYEPRYRLMLRRCLESPTPCFGITMPPRTVGSVGNGYGTMLEIRSVQMLPDGRSMVETWGTHRFRILETGTLDGYMVGRVERVDDIPVELEDEAEREIASMLAAQLNNQTEASSSSNTYPSPPAALPLQPTTEELIAICHAFIEQLRNGTAPWVVQRLNNTFGPMPTDTSIFSFWMAQVLPIDDHEKAKLLVIKSARGRLRLVVHWIEQLNSNW
ncbi:hypothetical protein DFH11DRAFT_661815 [Phellopilus nigrolimitatus]|nr:hypothetical protein DFH11DRAFT_661815 [Phellopilus nigrolimitatus]